MFNRARARRVLGKKGVNKENADQHLRELAARYHTARRRCEELRTSSLPHTREEDEEMLNLLTPDEYIVLRDDVELANQAGFQVSSLAGYIG